MADGLITVPSSFGPQETMDRLAAEVTAKGMTILSSRAATSWGSSTALRTRAARR